jgi:hypothetical protein
MSDTPHETAQSAAHMLDIRDGYVTSKQMAQARGVSPRTLRVERQRREGPPYVRDRREVLYPIDAYRAWLLENTRRPVSSAPPVKSQVKRRTRPSEPHHLDRRHAAAETVA